MKRAFTYFLKKRFKAILILAFAFVILNFIFLVNTDLIFLKKVDDNYLKIPGDSPLPMIMMLTFIITTLVPIYEFSFKMKKTNIDVFYSLPVKRIHLYLSIFLVGLLEIIIPIIFGYLTMAIYVIFKDTAFETIYFIPLFFEIIGGSIVLYIILTFLFLKGNTVLDGIMNIILSNIALPLVYGVINSFISFSELIWVDIADWSYLFPYSPLTTIFMHNQNLLYGYINESVSDYHINTIICNSIFSILALICLYGSYHYVVTSKAEDSMQLSKSYFSYRVMVPLIIVSLYVYARPFEAKFHTTLLVYLGITIVSYLLYCIWQRTFLLKKMHFIKIGIWLGLGLILSLIMFGVEQAISL